MSKALHEFCKSIVETDQKSKLKIGLKALIEKLKNPGADNTSVSEAMRMLDAINNSLSTLSFIGAQLIPGNAFRNFVGGFGKGINGGHTPDQAFSTHAPSLHSEITFGADIGLALTALWKQNIQIVKQIDCYTKNRTALEHDLKIAYVTLFNAFHPMLQECARGLHEAKKLNESGLSVEIAQKIWDQLVKYRSRWYCQL